MKFTMLFIKCFPGGSDGKESACNVGDQGSIPGSGRSPGEGHGNSLQYSCLKNLLDRGAWWATVHGISKSGTQLSDWHFLSVLLLVCILWVVLLRLFLFIIAQGFFNVFFKRNWRLCMARDVMPEIEDLGSNSPAALCKFMEILWCLSFPICNEHYLSQQSRAEILIISVFTLWETDYLNSQTVL